MQSAQAASFVSNHIDPIPTTLSTALHYLGLQDELTAYAVCPECDSIYRLDSEAPVPDKCSNRDSKGKVCSAPLFKQQHRGNRSWKKPIRRFTHQNLESWLSRFLNRPGIEDMLESTHLSNKGICTDVWGGSYLSAFPGSGQPSFFECPKDELRLGFLFYYDQFNYFMLKIAGKKRSSGLVMMVCLNLPPEVRYDLKNIYVTAMIPGPDEPNLDTINNFMRPIIDNLVEHYEPGVYISKTFNYPKGRRVRSVAPIHSLDLKAARPVAGIGGTSHSIFCSVCNARLSEIDQFDMSRFCARTLDNYQIGLRHWDQAKTKAEREMIWTDHAVRRSEWSRFSWWDPFTCPVIAPLHWTKNVLEKHICDNMGANSEFPADDGEAQPPPLKRPLTAVEVQWGFSAVLYSTEEDLIKTDLPEPLLRYICRKYRIYEAGLPKRRLIEDINLWRRRMGLVLADGTPRNNGQGDQVPINKAEFYLSRVKDSLLQLDSNSTIPALRGLCDKYSLPWNLNKKKETLMKRLVEYYHENVQVVVLEETKRPVKGKPLGREVIMEIKNDMQRTCLPSWIKAPPNVFASADYSKIGSEEWKTLGLITLPFTLIRIWSTSNQTLQKRLENLLHLSIAVRILSYQSLTDHDIRYFEVHYQAYLSDLKELYPYETVVPVQHLGLHIPQFMRKFGPPTRYSKNTCEMFIGMLEEISTNLRSGELEQTLHRELIMAANVKALLESSNFSDVLQPYAGIIGEFLQQRYPGSEQPSSQGWHTKRRGEAINIDPETYGMLSFWAKSNGTRPFTRHLHVCELLRRGNVVYQPFKTSRANSCIQFLRPGNTAAVPGRIEAILQEPNNAVQAPNLPRILVLARAFNPLSEQDAKNDPYHNNSIVGSQGFRIMRMFYDSVDVQQVYILEPKDIVSHVAICGFFDSERKMSAPCSVILDLDLKHTFVDT
ncbi:Transposase family Tnp2 protein [Ceratobasidium sp. AG-Ba]|nr:Transposase family Tnp2 protein [Ceratobasidium sp. AG-Ba]